MPWPKDVNIPTNQGQASRFRMRIIETICDHDMQPRTRLVAELGRWLEQTERAENEQPDPEQAKTLVLHMVEQRMQAGGPTQDTERSTPSGGEPLDLNESRGWGEASPFESRQIPRTKADLLNEIRQCTDRLTGQWEVERRQIGPWDT